MLVEIKLVEYYNLFKRYKEGYRPETKAKFAEVNNIVLAVVAEDSFVIGKVMDKKGGFYHLSIIHQLGERYHNSNNNTIYVNDFEIYEILE